MIEQADASKPSDERHVKYRRCNTNLLTQKKTGGKLIMGNQGTTNWKLTAFFAISLMLIAGLFSNAAIAGNGDGEITVGWSGDATDVVTGVSDVPTDSRDDDENGTADDVTAPLAAGSRDNSLKFTYTVEDVSMAGGLLQIDIPADWTIHKQVQDATTTFDETTVFDEVLVTVDTGDGTDVEIYDSMAQDITTAELNTTHINPAGTKSTHGEVTIGDPIKVTLGSGWFNGGTLVITLGNVQTAIPSSLRVAAVTDGYPDYTAYAFEARSQERNGRPVRLRPSTDNPNPQPRVRVGNILGNRLPSAEVADAAPVKDTTKREVTVDPPKSYPGETHDYIVVFTAPGPMYGRELNITFPADTDLALPPGDKTEIDLITVRAPGVAYEFDPNDTDHLSGRDVTIGLTRINKGQKVTVTLRGLTVADNVDATAAEANEFTVTTGEAGETDVFAVTKITGGTFHDIEGSGTLAVSPDNAEAGDPISRLTVTYTAVTKLENASILITVPTGIMASAKTGEADLDGDADTALEPTFRLQMTDSSKKGYVSSPDSKGAAPVLTVEDSNLETGTPTTIRWDAVDLDPAKSSTTTFRTYITGVRVQDEGGTLPFTAEVAEGADTRVALTDPANFTLSLKRTKVLHFLLTSSPSQSREFG